MIDLLQFIDSLDIREYNKETQFTPAEWAVLVSKSLKKTVEEKIAALQYLVDHYAADEFQEETITLDYWGNELQSFREVVIETIRAWKIALEARFEEGRTIFTAGLYEQDCFDQEWASGGKFFSSYEKAWEYLLRKKQEYLNDESLKDVKTYARIKRIKLDQEDTEYDEYGEWYLFDHEMRMVEVFVDTDRVFAGRKRGNLVNEYLAYVPLPFKKGDIVKVDFPQTGTHYGVFSWEWKKPEDTSRICMYASLMTYDGEFDYTDGIPYGDEVLGFSYCTDEELPEANEPLKLIRAVEKGEMDYYGLLCKLQR